jgi:site-specific DNA-cytosine methylase
VTAADLTIGSVCTGAGGLDLGLEWAGLGPVLWQVESDPRCRRVLARHWPNVRRLSHVQAIPAAARAGSLARVAIFVGGFPCQDLSTANPAGEGLAGERSGLFWWILDCVDALGPRVVVLENVGRLARRGLDVVVAELAGRGFAVEAARIRASDVGAPHQRERVFIIGYGEAVADALGGPVQRRRIGGELGGEERPTESEGVQRQRHGRVVGPGRAPGPAGGVGPTVAGVGRGLDGVSGVLDATRWPVARGCEQPAWEPARVRLRGRGDRARLKMLGNAVVPQCAVVVGLRVRQRLEGGTPYAHPDPGVQALPVAEGS